MPQTRCAWRLLEDFSGKGASSSGTLGHIVQGFGKGVTRALCLPRVPLEPDIAWFVHISPAAEALDARYGFRYYTHGFVGCGGWVFGVRLGGVGEGDVVEGPFWITKVFQILGKASLRRRPVRMR